MSKIKFPVISIREMSERFLEAFHNQDDSFETWRNYLSHLSLSDEELLQLMARIQSESLNKAALSQVDWKNIEQNHILSFAIHMDNDSVWDRVVTEIKWDEVSKPLMKQALSQPSFREFYVFIFNTNQFSKQEVWKWGMDYMYLSSEGCYTMEMDFWQYANEKFDIPIPQTYANSNLTLAEMPPA